MSTAHPTSYHQEPASDLKAILKLTGPILLTQLAQVGMGTIDTVMSGYVSTRDLAAVADRLRRDDGAQPKLGARWQREGREMIAARGAR